MITIKENNVPIVLSELEQKIALALESIGQTAEGYAKGECPVDTGRLRNSIANQIDDDSVYIGTNVVYGKYVEFNDHVGHKTGKAHFLRDSISAHGDEYKAIIEAALKE